MVFMYYLNFITGYFWNLDSSVFTFLLWDWEAYRDTGLGWGNLWHIVAHIQLLIFTITVVSIS